MPPTSKSQQLGNLIRERRQARELSLRQLADSAEHVLPQDVSFDQAYLHRLEAGRYRKPHPAILKALSECLACDSPTSTPWPSTRSPRGRRTLTCTCERRPTCQKKPLPV